VVTQVRFTGRRLDSQRSDGQKIVSAMHATLGRGLLVLLNGHVDTPKKSVRLAFKPGQCRKRIDPFARIGRTRQTTFFVPRRDWQGQEDFILHKFSHIQFACQRQEIPGVVFQFVLRHVGTFRNNFQQVVDIKFKRDCLQAALAGQRNRSANSQMQHQLAAFALETLKPEADAPRHFGQQIMQAFQAGNRQLSFESTTFPGKHESVRNPFQS